MILLRCALLLFLALAIPATSQSQATSAEPKLPIIDYNACPFEGCNFGKWKVTKESALYSSWQEGRKEIGRLKSGEQVSATTGVHITRKPDRILIKAPIAELGVQPGDVVLRYMSIGEGFFNIWVHGHWYKEYDCSFVTAKDVEGCIRDCAAVVIEYGQREWWVKITISDNISGWVLVDDNFDGMDSLAKLESRVIFIAHAR